jgi:hypothetical protein
VQLSHALGEFRAGNELKRTMMKVLSDRPSEDDRRAAREAIARYGRNGKLTRVRQRVSSRVPVCCSPC